MLTIPAFDSTIVQDNLDKNGNENNSIPNLQITSLLVEDGLGIDQESGLEPISNPPRKFPKNHPMNDYSDVLVVVNENSSISQQIGQYFKEQRDIPNINMCVINTSISESIDSATFHNLRGQIENYLQTNNLTDKINYIVTTKGVPLRITSGGWQRHASVDSELTLILERFSQYIDHPTSYQIANNYYNKNYDFSRKYYYMYLVTRLTGYDYTDVKQLIDNAAASAGIHNGGGAFFFDRDPDKGNNHRGNTRMDQAHNILTDRQIPSSRDFAGQFRTDRNNLAGYASWGGFDDQYLVSPMSNTGFETDSAPADGVPDGWFFEIFNSSDNVSRNTTINHWGDWSVNITRLEYNATSYTAVSQNVTVVAGRKYFLRGWVQRDGISAGGGAHLQIKAFDAGNNMVRIQNATPIYGTWAAFSSLNKLGYDPIPGVTKLTISAVLTGSSGTAYFDDIALYEVRPRHSYVPGAIAEVYGYDTALTFDEDYYNYRFYVNLNVGEFIEDGITGIKGQVDYSSPYIDTNSHAGILFERYTSGYNLAESYYMATPYVSWMDVVIGDPKTSPYFDLLPDVTLVPENITFSKKSPNQGDTIKVYANIENRGGSDIKNFNVTFKVGSTYDKAKSLGYSVIPSVAKDESLKINMNWNTSKYNGTQTVWVFVDSSNWYREQVETNNLVSNQIDINAYPEFNNLKIMNKKVYRGETAELIFNTTDLEINSSDLKCTFNIFHSTFENWLQVSTQHLNNDIWEAEFITNATTPTGWFKIEISITDVNNATIKYQQNKVFEVLNNPPELSELVISRKVVYRNEYFEINFSASDFEDEIKFDMFTVYLRRAGKEWKNISEEPEYHSDQDYWQVKHLSNKKDRIGKYDIKVEILDNDGDMSTIELLNAIEMLNNLPEIDKVTVSEESILRGGYALIHILGNDYETPSGKMEVVLEQRLVLDTISWSNESLTDVKWDSSATRWEATFFTDPETLTGNYSFRAKLIDEDLGTSEFLIAETELEVFNTPPEAKIEISSNVVNEEEKITFDGSKSTDLEDFLISRFEWDFGDGASSSKEKLDHSFTKSGTYNVTLTVFDKNFASDQARVRVTIKNVPPVAEMSILSSQATLKVNQPIEFDGTISIDTDSDRTNLSYFWDFNDGYTSDQPNVTHTYTAPGAYKVILKVTDDDGALSTKTRDIQVEPSSTNGPNGEPEGKRSKEPWYQSFNFIIILLVIIVIIALGLITWITMHKREPKEKPAPKKPVKTVEATIVDTPERAVVAPGQTVKPGFTPTDSKDAVFGTSSTAKSYGITTPEKPAALPPPTSRSAEKQAPPPKPEVEIEFEPKLEYRTPQEPAPEPQPTTPEPEIEVHLPESAGQIEGIEPEKEPFKYPDEMPREEPAGEDLDFEVPKIDLTGIYEEPGQPAQQHRHEIVEAKKRGEDVSFDFKLPDAKKKKK
jgi:uncharacterized protein (TIGR03790 family)